MKTLTMIAFVLTLMIIGAHGYSPAASAEEGKSVEQMITEAKTPADHEAIAAYYDKEAADAHERHAKHRQMAANYKKAGAQNKSGFSTHCRLIAARYEKTAKEFEALAKLHRDMATKPAE